MPVTVRTSGKQAAIKKSRTSRKRRENQNVVINELASLVPLSTPLVSCDSSSGSLVPSSGNKPPTISVLRLTTSYLKLQSFLKTSDDSSSSNEHVSTDNPVGRMEEAIDGFLIILDKDANILYVSETIAGHVGLLQLLTGVKEFMSVNLPSPRAQPEDKQDVIGQNLADITHSEFSSEITDSLKPALVLPSTVNEECVVSQYRQFYVRFIPSVSYSTTPLHSIVQVSGNLKVKLSPSKNCSSDIMEFVEPTAIGFTGECRVVESVPSILEISAPCSSFIVTRSLDLKKVISIEASVKDVIGYDPEVILDERFNPMDFFHPADVNLMESTHRCLMQTGHVVSPRFRFLTSSGDWVWVQMEGRLRYKNDKSPQYWEVKIRALSQWRGRMKYIEQKEVYSTDSDEDIPNTDNNSDIIQKHPIHTDHSRVDDAKRMINSLKSTNLPDSVLEPVLHGRSLAMSGLSEAVKQFLSEKSTREEAVGSSGDQSVLKGNDSISLVTESTAVLAQCSPTTQVERSYLAESVVCQTIVNDGTFSPDGSIMSTGQQALSPDQYFPNFSNPTGSCSSLLETSPVSGNSTLSADVSLPCEFSPETGLSLHSAMSTESLQSASSAISQTIDFSQVHQTNVFSTQFPSTFDFSSNTSELSSHHAPDPLLPSNFFPTQALDHSMPDAQSAFDSSNLAPINLSDSLIQQMSGEMIEHHNFNSPCSAPDQGASFESIYSRNELQPNIMQNSISHNATQDNMSYAQAQMNFSDDVLSMLVSDSPPNISESNPEVQDILQQFM